MDEQQKETFLAWLRDAHAMEQGLINVLEQQIDDTKDLPEVRKKLEEHLEETHNHAAKVETILRRYDSDTSGGKDTLSKLSSMVSGITSSISDDALVKNMHSSYAAEHFEIGAYTLLRGVAEEFDDQETVQICDDILRDEEAMADFILEHLPHLAIEHLQEVSQEEE